MIKRNELIILGRINKPHGFGGEMLLVTDGNLKINAKKMPYVFLDPGGDPIPFPVKSIKQKNDSEYYLSLDWVDNEHKAADWNGISVLCLKYAITVKAREKKIADVIGFKVTDEQFGYIGLVTEVIDLPVNPLLKVENDGKEILIPIAESIILAVDGKKKEIRTSVPDGLLDL